MPSTSGSGLESTSTASDSRWRNGSSSRPAAISNSAAGPGDERRPAKRCSVPTSRFAVRPPSPASSPHSRLPASGVKAANVSGKMGSDDAVRPDLGFLRFRQGSPSLPSSTTSEAGPSRLRIPPSDPPPGSPTQPPVRPANRAARPRMRSVDRANLIGSLQGSDRTGREGFKHHAHDSLLALVRSLASRTSHSRVDDPCPVEPVHETGLDTGLVSPDS